MDSFCESNFFRIIFECTRLMILLHDRFETIEAAERCIISLRRYRNLHPTFSKVHIHSFET